MLLTDRVGCGGLWRRIMKLASELGLEGIPHMAVVDKAGNQKVDEAKRELVDALRQQTVEDTVLRWRKATGDWTAGKSDKLGGDSQAESVEDMRAARLKALEARMSAGAQQQ